MKKRMLKISALVSLAMLLTAGFAGCKKTECEWCGEMKRCKTVYLSMLGEYNMCEECERYTASMSENLEGLEDVYGIGE